MNSVFILLATWKEQIFLALSVTFLFSLQESIGKATLQDISFEVKQVQVIFLFKSTSLSVFFHKIPYYLVQLMFCVLCSWVQY